MELGKNLRTNIIEKSIAVQMFPSCPRMGLALCLPPNATHPSLPATHPPNTLEMHTLSYRPSLLTDLGQHKNMVFCRAHGRAQNPAHICALPDFPLK